LWGVVCCDLYDIPTRPNDGKRSLMREERWGALRFPSSTNCERFAVRVILKIIKNLTHIMTDMSMS
jgi:hypothetical protein